jgi:hypothetical protein
VSENVKIDAATSPGAIKGTRTRRNVIHPRPPRSLEASSSEPGTRSIAAYTGRIANGSQR